MLVKKEVEIRGERFTVSEISIGKMLPIMPGLSGTTEEQQDAQMSLMKVCIEQKGKPMGEAVLELGLSVYMELIQYIMEVNGLQTPEEDEGKAD